MRWRSCAWTCRRSVARSRSKLRLSSCSRSLTRDSSSRARYLRVAQRVDEPVDHRQGERDQQDRTGPVQCKLRRVRHPAAPQRIVVGRGDQRDQHRGEQRAVRRLAVAQPVVGRITPGQCGDGDQSRSPQQVDERRHVRRRQQHERRPDEGIADDAPGLAHAASARQAQQGDGHERGEAAAAAVVEQPQPGQRLGRHGLDEEERTAPDPKQCRHADERQQRLAPPQPQHGEQQRDRRGHGRADPGDGVREEELALVAPGKFVRRSDQHAGEHMGAAAIGRVDRDGVVAGDQRLRIDRDQVRTPPAHLEALVRGRHLADEAAVDHDAAAFGGVRQQQRPGFGGCRVEAQSEAEARGLDVGRLLRSPAQRQLVTRARTFGRRRILDGRQPLEGVEEVSFSGNRRRETGGENGEAQEQPATETRGPADAAGGRRGRRRCRDQLRSNPIWLASYTASPRECTASLR